KVVAHSLRIRPKNPTGLSTAAGTSRPQAASRAVGSVPAMFFLFRVAFWLSIVLVLLPSGDYRPKDQTPQIGAVDAVNAATAAVSDLSGFCGRQPDACEVGGKAAVAFGQRA